MSSFSEQVFQEKLTRLSSSQDSIETLSLWIIHHKAHSTSVVDIWMQNFIQADPERRLLLLYLVNDVLQNGRRKGVDVYRDLYQDPLRHAASLVRELKIQPSVERIIHIWQERRVYDNVFLKELEDLIEPSNQNLSAKKKEKMDFKITLLEDCLLELSKFEGEMKIKSIALSQVRIDVSTTDSLSKLKDKSAGGKFKKEFEDASHKLQEYFECVGIEVSERENLLSMLEDCKKYHQERLTELEGLLKNYQKLQSHFEYLKEKLKEKIDELDKAQHTATSDPTSKKDINVVGDMEIDSDSESQGDEAPPTQPHPSVQFPTNQFIPPQGVPFPSNEFTPPPFPTPPPAVQKQAYPLPLSNPSSLPSLPPRPPLFTHIPPPSNIPYSPSMPKHFSPLTPSTGLPPLPPFPNVLPCSNPMIDHKSGIAPPSSSHSQIAAPGESAANLENRLKNLVTTKTLPESLFQDYSDSDSELDENDKPYSPSSMVLISPMKKRDNSTDSKEFTEDTGPDKILSSDDNNSINFYGSGDYVDQNILPSKPDTVQADTSLPTSDSINPDDIKITPSLTQLLGQIFPQLSKSLENQRKRKNDDQDNNMIEDSSKLLKTESTVKTEGLETQPDIPVQSSTTGGIPAPPAPPSVPLYPNHTHPHLFPQPPFNNTSPFLPPPPPHFRYPGPPQMFLSPQENMRPPPNWSNQFHSQTPPPSLRPRYF